METNNEKTFKCLNCGKETTSKRNNIFCSNECYLEFRKRPNQIMKKELYAELIIRSMRYGIKHIVIDLEDAEKCKNYKWFLSFDEILNSFYVKTSKYPYSLHRVIMDCPKGFVVDHINHNTLDNRKENLRICTHAENMKNRKRVRECVNCIDLKRQNEELQKENEELKKQNNQLANGIDEQFSKIVELEGRNNLRRYILTEIKEIAEQCFGKDFCTDCKYYEQCYVEDEKIPTFDVCKLILQKISECEVKDENN